MSKNPEDWVIADLETVYIPGQQHVTTLEVELASIDSILARRPALDIYKTRAAKIERAISVAKESDQLRSELIKVQEAKEKEFSSFAFDLKDEVAYRSVIEKDRNQLREELEKARTEKTEMERDHRFALNTANCKFSNEKVLRTQDNKECNRLFDENGRLHEILDQEVKHDRDQVCLIQTLRARVKALEGCLQNLSIDGCEYGDNCPTFGSKHYQCRPCQMLEVLNKDKEGK